MNPVTPLVITFQESQPRPHAVSTGPACLALLWLFTFWLPLLLHLDNEDQNHWQGNEEVLHKRSFITRTSGGSQPGSHSQVVAELAYSQVQDTEPAAIPSSPQKACGPVDRLSAFRVQDDVPGTIPAPAPVLLLEPPTLGSPRNPVGQDASQWGRARQEGGRSLYPSPRSTQGSRDI